MKYKTKTPGFLVAVLFVFILNTGCDKIIPGNGGNEEDIERQIFDMVNQHRVSMGLNALEWNETIAQQCRNHSSNMASGAVPIGHGGFEQRAANIGNTISYTTIAENVAYYNTGLGSSNPASLAVNGWLDSSSHRENIEGNFNLTGVGVTNDGNEYYYTQIYADTD